MHFVLPMAMVFAASAGAVGAEFRIQDLESSISSQSPRTIEEVLALLPLEYRQEYTVIFSSKSRQAASKTNPRIVFYGPSAKLLIAFNGHSKMAGGNMIEAIQFNDQTDQFEFYEITENPSAPVTLTRPKNCIACHAPQSTSHSGEVSFSKDPWDLRPNWTPYSSWPGVVGSENDMKTAEEFAVIQNLAAMAAAGHPRYRWVPDLSKRYAGDLGSRYLVETNINLTQRLAQHNFRRVTRLIQKTPDYDRFKYAILASTECGHAGIAQWLPGPIRPRGGNGYFARLGERNGDSAFFYLFKSRKIDTRSWDMAHLPSEDVFKTPGSYPSELAGWLALRDPELAAYVEIEKFDYHESDGYRVKSIRCGELESKARASFAGWTPSSAPSIAP